MTTVATKPIPHLKGNWLLGSFSEFQNDRLEFMAKVANQCDDVGSFRVGPLNVVMLNSPAMIQAVLNDNAEHLYGGRFFEFVKPVLGDKSLAVSYGTDHMRLRRLMAPAFQHKRLVAYSEVMGQIVDDFQRSLQDGTRIDVGLSMSKLTRDVLAKTLFTSKKQEDLAFFESIRVAAAYITDRTSNPFSAPLSWPTPKNQRTREALRLLRARAAELVEEGRANQGQTNDLLSALLAARDEDGSRLSEEELLDQVLTLYLAGHETTANSTSWLMLAMGQHPEVQERIYQETYALLQGRIPTYEDLAKLPYTMQVIKEAMRMYPPTAFMSRSPLKDIEVMGYKFPKDQFIIISPHALHRAAKYFENPDRFDPDRFSPENEKKIPRGAYMPFGLGPHVCIGQRFALFEVQIILSHLVQHLRVELVPNQTVVPVPLATVAPSQFFVTVSRRHQAPAMAS